MTVNQPKQQLIKKNGQILYLASCLSLMFLGLLLLLMLLPVLNPYQSPRLSLDGLFVEVGLFLSSYSVVYVPLIMLVMVYLFASFVIAPFKRALFALAIVCIVSVLTFSLVQLSGFVLKPALEMPRPHVFWLSQQNKINGGENFDLKHFYDLPTEQEKRLLIDNSLQALGNSIKISDQLKLYWRSKTTYSMPSNHSMAVFSVMTALLCLFLLHGWQDKKTLFVILYFWALMMALSRLIIRVHSPFDVAFGALLGILNGVFIYSVLYCFMKLSSDYFQSKMKKPSF